MYKSVQRRNASLNLSRLFRPLECDPFCSLASHTLLSRSTVASLKIMVSLKYRVLLCLRKNHKKQQNYQFVYIKKDAQEEHDGGLPWSVCTAAILQHQDPTFFSSRLANPWCNLPTYNAIFQFFHRANPTKCDPIRIRSDRIRLAWRHRFVTCRLQFSPSPFSSLTTLASSLATLEFEAP